MINRILTPADIQRITVGQEGPTAFFLDQVSYNLGKIRTQKREVARFPEMNFNRRKLILKIDRLHPCRADQTVQLFEKAVLQTHTQICKINL
ncbi:Uncharacterised protein [Anaerotruncus colihominis]|uniref:Uncharacterized protein n=1 Tax=Anaerotruncus colihominis TaxID=169435 RepID=A0A174NEW3_9FIRM|nr:Uncharacterised protein [Anaerotruncus colihominis]